MLYMTQLHTPLKKKKNVREEVGCNTGKILQIKVKTSEVSSRPSGQLLALTITSCVTVGKKKPTSAV